ncbi:hypothetical protein [Luteolibacter luteus]|uniref:Uncharacterized protein n=1 Tax=Luteolibacter luteus TaxID=2728835 RepID=A0A858RFL6_9BACT|nr:hypothetical protein [Luteolibacter luteus]QJE95391.1 hypothetical protein HHL09_06215 [Luteolibacter luteus]
MFKRVILEDWATVVPMIAFGVLFAVFAVTTVRALLIRPKDRERMSRMPLEDSEDDR